METEKDMALWRIAKKRVEFKRHLATYIIINGMFWLLWYFTESQENDREFPWPVWPMLGWGVGLAFSYMKAYVYTRHNSIEKEYEKLKDRNKF
jgi:hypothetical protein